MAAKYAQNTKVSVTTSIEEIKRLVRKFGATEFSTYENDQTSVIGFTINGLRITQSVRVPTTDEMTYSPAGQWRDSDRRHAAVEQELRRRWRVLVVYLKAKLTAIEEGITTVEQEFLSQVVVGDGSATVGDVVIPHLREVSSGAATVAVGGGAQVSEVPAHTLTGFDGPRADGDRDRW